MSAPSPCSIVDHLEQHYTAPGGFASLAERDRSLNGLMLEKPGVADDVIVTFLHDHFGLVVAALDFLPLGADANTAAYRAVDIYWTGYFLKLRRGEFDGMSVLLPAYLASQGHEHIIAPLSTASGALWADLAGYKAILYPFVAGVDCYERPLTIGQNYELGQTVRAIHATTLPFELGQRLRAESFSAEWRDSVRAFMQRIDTEQFSEPTAIKLAAFLAARRPQVEDLVAAADRLARVLKPRALPSVLCHGDLHAGNVLLSDDGRWYLVDWDDPILAPKERDLMHIGGGVGVSSVWTDAAAGTLFFEGYGQAEIDRPALAYYRCERAIQDIAAVCRAILEATVGPEDQERGLGFLMISFEPGDVVDIALRTVAAAASR